MTECRKIQKTQDVRVEQYFRKICGIILLILLLTGIWGMSAKVCQTQLVKENRYEQSHCDLSVEK